MLDMNINYIEQYWDDIKSGRTITSAKVKKQVEKLINDINDKDSKWVFDVERGNRAIFFIEKYCRHSKGDMAGKPFILETWQRAFVSAIFGFIDKKKRLRRFRKVLLFVARKNGKSTLAAGIALYMLIGTGEGGAEIYSVATKRDQAKAVWNEARNMIKQSKELSKLIKLRVSDITADFCNSVFKALGSDSNRLDGLNSYCVIADEVHAWRDMNLYDVMIDSMTARSEPLFFEASTAGTIRGSVFDQEYEYASNVVNGVDGFKDDRLLAFLYELDNKNEWTDEKCWSKANPALFTIKDKDALAQKVREAQLINEKVKNLLCKDFNIRETSTDTWLSFDDINNTETYDISKLNVRYGIGGVDLSSTTDLTSAKVIFKIHNDPKTYVISMYFMPEEMLEKRVVEDKIPYDVWVEKGLLRLSSGNRVNYHDVTKWFIEVQREMDVYIMWVGYDAWSASYWVEEMKEVFGKEVMIPVHQGKKSLSEPTKRLGADLKSKLVVYNNNPIDKWCLSNTAIDTDKNGNIQPCKTNNPRRRIDGTASLIDAYYVYLEKEGEYLSYI